MGVNIIRTQDEKAKKVFVNWQKKQHKTTKISTKQFFQRLS